MQIICPECQFTRVVDESKIPARSQVATCPKCQTKFQFRELEPEEPEFEIEPEPEQAPVRTKPNKPAQGTLPMEPPPAQAEDEYEEADEHYVDEPDEPYVDEPYEDGQHEEPAMPEPIGYDPGEQDIAEDARVDEKDEGPVFPEMPAPERQKKLQHPSGEIWEKLHNMTPPGKRVEDDEPAQSPFDDEPEVTVRPGHAEQKPVPGWTGEFNSDFPDPMDEGARHDDDDDGQAPLVPPPFEQLDRYGFFHGLYMTIKLVLTSPRLFFSVMPVGGGFSKPLTFTILVTLIQTFVQYFWGMVGLSASAAQTGGEQVSGAAGAFAPVFMLLLLPAFVAASQFFLTGFYHLLLSLMRAGNKGFEGTFRALAYANTPIILGLFPMPMMEIEMGWMLVVGIWGLFLTIIGLKNIHKTSYAKVIPVTIIPLLLAMILGLLAIQAGVATI